MPREAKGPRLYLEPARERGTRKIPAVYVIRDGSRKISTKCGEDAYQAAQEKLDEYRQQKYIERQRGNRHAASIPIADVLILYLQDKAQQHARPQETDARVNKLLDFFGDKMLDYVTGQTCRAYVKSRSSQSSARRELEDLRAAIRHHRMEGLCNQVIDVRLPPKSQPRERWLTRSETARLLYTAWRTSPHVARFILIGIYTGTRSGAIFTASLSQVSGRGYIDTKTGIFYRKAFGKKATKKRQPPIILPGRILAHIRRWQRLGLCNKALIEYHGEPITRITKAFTHAAERAALPNVTPHTLRHTAATWMMENGAEPSDVAKYLGMTEAMIEQTYGHIGSKALERAAAALTRRS